MATSDKPMADLERVEVVEDVPIEAVITEEFIKRLEKVADLYQNRYLPLCFKLTNEFDWTNHGSRESPRFYLQASGAEKLCNPFGIVWDRPAVVKHELKDDKGDYYEYEIEGIMQCRVLRRYGWFTGNCSSRDQFFAARGRFDEGDIRKAALSNWIVNGVTRLTGIRNPDPAMLQRAGLDPAKITVIDYSGRRRPEDDATVISEAQQKRLWAIAKEHKITPEQIKDKLAADYKLDSSAKIPRGKYDEHVAWVQAGAPAKKNGGA